MVKDLDSVTALGLVGGLRLVERLYLVEGLHLVLGLHLVQGIHVVQGLHLEQVGALVGHGGQRECCQLGGIEVALTGATVVATGVFDRAPDDEGVLWRSEVVPILDVRALYAEAEAATWTHRVVPPGETPPGKAGRGSERGSEP